MLPVPSHHLLPRDSVCIFWDIYCMVGVDAMLWCFPGISVHLQGYLLHSGSRCNALMLSGLALGQDGGRMCVTGKFAIKVS